MKYFLLLLLAVFLGGCKHNYYLFGRAGDPDPVDYRRILLDSTYELYVRKVVRVGEEGNKDLESKQKTRRSKENPLIEVEYLLLSDSNNDVIYFSTLADKFQKYYQQYYLGDGYVNVEDFETICFGTRQDEHTFIFTSGDTALHSYDTWTWRKDDSGGKVLAVQEFVKGEFQLFIPAVQALKDSIFFKRVGAFSIVHHYPTFPLNENVIPIQDETIHIMQDGGCWVVYFVFTQPISNGYKKIKFLDNRIPFSPETQ
jgi:hypothetical protein